MSARISIKLAADSMAAWVVVDTGTPATQNGLERALAAAGVRKGILPPTLADIGNKLESEDYSCAGELIAEGQLPVNGEDGRVELAIPSHIMAGTLHNHERIDFRDRGAITNVESGHLIATYYPPDPGTTGFDVRGSRLLPEPVKSGLPELGKGVEMQRQADAKTGAQLIRASRNGVVTHTLDTCLDVTDLFQHDGDVDYAIGNLDVHGTAWVTGTVQPNFSVHATGDVIIDGNIDHASVHTSGNLRVGNGIVGIDDGGIKAKGNLSCRFASNSALIAGAELSIAEHSLGCDLQAGHLQVHEGRGRIAGGRVRTEHSIYVIEAGSDGDVETLLETGLPLQELAELRHGKRAEDRQRRSHIKQSNQLKTGRRSKGGKQGREATKMAQRSRELSRAVRQRERELLRTAEIVIEQRAHVGVTLKIGPCTLRLTEPSAGGRFIYQEETNSIVKRELPR